MVYCIENPTEEPSGKSVGFFFCLYIAAMKGVYLQLRLITALKLRNIA